MDKDILQALSNLLDEKLKIINNKLDEHTQILRALEHSAEVNKSERGELSRTLVVGVVHILSRL